MARTLLSLALLGFGLTAWITLARQGEALDEAFRLRTQLLDEIGAPNFTCLASVDSGAPSPRQFCPKPAKMPPFAWPTK